jgi:hypothetical protein
MTRYLGGDDPEPAERVPAGLLLVPVRSGPEGDVLRMFRTPLGERTAIGFTSGRQLAAVLGPQQAAVVIAEPALRAMADALGITRITVDPQLAATPAAALHGPDGWHPWRAHGVPDAAGAQDTAGTPAAPGTAGSATTAATQTTPSVPRTVGARTTGPVVAGSGR